MTESAKAVSEHPIANQISALASRKQVFATEWGVVIESVIRLEAALAACQRDSLRYAKARTMPFVLDHGRITPHRPEKFDELIDAALDMAAQERTG